MQYDYNQLLTTVRKRLSTINRSNASEQFYSDRSRVIYNSSFRRLQQKAQVFSLEPNASVRTRLTHSLEVSDLGRTLANKIAQELCSKGLLSAENISSFIAVVENACLLHDIGNPPFGHFGESAIRDWAQNRALNALPTDMCKSDTLKKLLSDFEEFDGNPQGFRIVTKLYTDYDQYSLNLTYATLLSILKYSRAAGEEPIKGKAILKKAGYFQSELPLVKEIYQSVGLELHHRYPLTYIMELRPLCHSHIQRILDSGAIDGNFSSIPEQQLHTSGIHIKLANAFIILHVRVLLKSCCSLCRSIYDFGFHLPRTPILNFPKKTNNPNPSPIGNKFGLFLFGPSGENRTHGLLNPIVLLAKTQWTPRYHLYAVSSNFKLILSFCFVRCQDVSFLLWSNCGQTTPTNDFSPPAKLHRAISIFINRSCAFCLHELSIRRICQPCQ